MSEVDGKGEKAIESLNKTDTSEQELLAAISLSVVDRSVSQSAPACWWLIES